KSQTDIERLVVERAFKKVVEERVSGVTNVCVAHIAIEGAVVGPNERGTTQEYEFPVGALSALDMLVVAGHVHYYQQLANQVYYSGSPVVPTFGEDYHPGFLFIDTEANNSVEFWDTPS